jgi:hypothetical protein
MNTITPVLLSLDPLLIAPFRWLPSAPAGYFLGTTILALYCIILGDLSASLVTFFNRKYIRRMQAGMDHNHELSETALKLGDKESYKAVNRQGLETFGHSFSLGAAIFCVSIWPMPFALSWLSLRFVDAPLELPVAIPFVGNSIEYFPSFLLLYIAIRMIYSSAMGRVDWYRTAKARLVGQALQA